MGFRLSIAATKDDWVSLIKHVKGDELLRFYEMSAWKPEDIVPMHLEDLPNLGVARTGMLVQEDPYLVLPASVPVVPREIHLNAGGVRYDLDQSTNPDSFVFRPGGLWKDDCYVTGEISSLYDLGLSITLAKKMMGVVRRKYRPCGLYRMGPKCSALYSHCKFTADCRY